MSVSFIGLLMAAMGAVAALRSTYWAILVWLFGALLGAAAAITIGSASILPGYFALSFLLFAIFIRPNQRIYLPIVFLAGRPGIYLLAAIGWAMVSSILLPRLFAGQIRVIGLDGDLAVLTPVGSNIYQAIYAMAGPLTLAIVAAYAQSAKAMKQLAYIVMIISIVNIAFAVIDVVTVATGLESLLNFIRNADYAQHFGQRIMGIKRINGSFAEPSSFAAITAMFFAFNLRLWRAGLHPRVTGWVALFSLLAILFSFSSTGYVSLIVYLSFAYFTVAVGIESRSSLSYSRMTNKALFLSLIPAISFVGMLFLAVRPELLDPVVQVFDTSLASKLQSDSGQVRSRWNEEGLRVFLETYGLGAGTGSVRTSNFAIAVLANLGVIGALLYLLFFIGLFSSKPETKNPYVDTDLIQYAAAARAACFVGFIGSMLAGTTIDLGLMFYAFAGIALASVFYSKNPAHFGNPARNWPHVPTLEKNTP